MKTVYTISRRWRFLMVGAFVFSLFSAKAVTDTITLSNTAFSPFTLNANVGDTVLWIWTEGNHTTTSGNVPNGAVTWDAPLNVNSPSFSYVLQVAGSYNYFCSFHLNLTGIINAAGSNGISNPFPAVPLSLYPMPFHNQLSIVLGSQFSDGTYRIYDLSGRLYYTGNLSGGKEATVTLNTAALAAGFYYCAIDAADNKQVIKLLKN